jgi:hypothetical protein
MRCDGDATATALIDAFTRIVGIASSDRVIRVLRPAIVALLEEPSTSKP